MNNNDNANVFSANEINEATNFMRPEGNAAQNGATNDTTEVINPAAPVSSKAMAKTNWGKRLGIVGAGVAAGAGAVFAASAGGSSGIEGLAPGAEPDATDDTPADSVDVVPENAADLPNSIGADGSQIIDGNPVGNLHGHAASTINVNHFHHDNLVFFNDHGVPMLHVDDHMSFAQAFAVARHQLGAGGAFEWHGHVYGTYYAEEWNSMPSFARAEYLHHVHYPDHYNHIVEVHEVVHEPHIHYHIEQNPVMDDNHINVAEFHETADWQDTPAMAAEFGDEFDEIHPDEISVVDDSQMAYNDYDNPSYDFDFTPADEQSYDQSFDTAYESGNDMGYDSSYDSYDSGYDSSYDSSYDSYDSYDSASYDSPSDSYYGSAESYDSFADSTPDTYDSFADNNVDMSSGMDYDMGSDMSSMDFDPCV